MALGSKMLFSLAMGIAMISHSIAVAESPVSSSSGGYQFSMDPQEYGPPPSPSYGPPPSPPSPPSAVYGPPSPSYGTPFGQHGYTLDSESPFTQKRLFNTVIALTIPLFSFTMPQRSSSNGGVDLANQVLFGGFVAIATLFTFLVPILFTKPSATGRSSDRDGILNNLMGNNKMFNFMNADVSNKVGLEPTKCLQKSICEANRTPKKYGVMAAPFQMFFPPPSNTTAAISKASVFQMAAKNGKYTKNDCGKLYNCFFDMMDLGNYMVQWWKSGDPSFILNE